MPLNTELLQSLREVDGTAHMHFELLNEYGIVASCYVEGWERPGGCLMRLHVMPTQRRKGYGTELIKAVIRATYAEAKSALSLSVKPDNMWALRMYHRLGFVVYYQLEGKNGDYLMTLDMTGKLPPVVVEMQKILQQAIAGGGVGKEVARG
ncbi:GNAT family N-acetyltransferase [Hymenobacter terricola]|uniref:GNAT family N-acetyltransferase n=1 Tax=Hymenobacter terricola TaxID=2819236 RepID=UPI001B310836|nr:GNAT family N-acetyltransferase [Hymenobacter terricola]